MRRLLALSVVLLVACSDMPHKDVPPPGAAGPPPNPRLVEDPRATPAETSPVPSSARVILEEWVRGALDARETALAMERILADTRDELMAVDLEWKCSARRALVHALLSTPRELRSELQRYQDERSRFEVAPVGTELDANQVVKLAPLADRFPNASFAQLVWQRLEKERGLSPREPVAISMLAQPVPPGGLRLDGLSVRADGDDVLVATDADGNSVWEHRAHAPSPSSLRVLGTFLDRLIVFEPKLGILEGIELATGNDLFRLTLPTRDASVAFAIVGPEAVFAVPGHVWVVDVLRGRLAWERGHDRGLPLAVTPRTVVLGSEAYGLDLATGRIVEGAPGTPRTKHIDVK